MGQDPAPGILRSVVIHDKAFEILGNKKAIVGETRVLFSLLVVVRRTVWRAEVFCH